MLGAVDQVGIVIGILPFRCLGNTKFHSVSLENK